MAVARSTLKSLSLCLSAVGVPCHREELRVYDCRPLDIRSEGKIGKRMKPQFKKEKKLIVISAV
jgi:hypothetical protein